MAGAAGLPSGSPGDPAEDGLDGPTQGSTPVSYSPLDLPGNVQISVALTSPHSVPAFTRPPLMLRVTAQTSGGRVLDPTGIALQICLQTSRTADPTTFTWIDTDPDANTGLHEAAEPEGLVAGNYSIGWRWIDGDATFGGWLPDLYNIL